MTTEEVSCARISCATAPGEEWHALTQHAALRIQAVLRTAPPSCSASHIHPSLPALHRPTGVQEKIAAELDAAGLLASPSRPRPRELQLDDLRRLRYLAAATKEAMRMYPVVSVGNGRCAGWWVMGGGLGSGRLLSGAQPRACHVACSRGRPAAVRPTRAWARTPRSAHSHLLYGAACMQPDGSAVPPLGGCLRRAGAALPI
jgi:hypothetical protein